MKSRPSIPRISSSWGAAAATTVFLRPLVLTRLSQADAYLLAAFLVAMGDDDDEWKRVLQAIRNT